jgi:LuxR family transcriptional regulator, maltose regulon positive regulatory protein
VDRATPRLVDRGDLLAALDRAAARQVTIISAPAGSGKTSLLRAWADRPGRAHRLALLQVQRDQHDAQSFWLALLNAVRRASGAAGDVEPPAATPGFNGRAMVDRVLSELADARDGITLVIDDLHELSSPEALGLLTRLLTALPPDVHAHQRTEGWAAGLRLAAISLAGHPDPERFVAEFSGSNRAVAEYLVAEMLERQPEDVQQLLLRTSLLDRVNGELADLLTGRAGSERILLELEDANAFVVSLNPERTWFRYHHLFGDLLRLELRRTLPEEVPALHRLAAGWFTRQGQVVDAIRHIQAAGDWADAARLLADHSFSLTLDGQAQTIQALLRAFPAGRGSPGAGPGARRG